MPDYSFRSLSPVDFELLTRDLLNADLGLRLHSYAPGRDQGIDLRQVDGNGNTIVVQCKHYVESSRETFLRAVRKEGERGQTLTADRYLFVTSRPLTPRLQTEIFHELQSLPLTHDDIWGKEELNAALGRHPDVERRHIKLWIASAQVLDSLINSGRWQRGEAVLAALASKAQLWVQTQSYLDVLQMLERDGICILTGPPGVGKTFLAEMVLLGAAATGWNVMHVSDNIEEAWAGLLPDETPQIFYYDDFLGQAALELASKNEANSLRAFLDRVRQLRGRKRIILTTREQVLRQAAEEMPDRLSELSRHPARFSLQMEAYNPHVRAQILFNHLYFSGLPVNERGLLSVNRLISITEHPSFNPRIIETATRFATELTAEELLATLGRVLNNPNEVWRGSFQTLSALEQRILLTLATLPSRPCSVVNLRRLVIPEEALAWSPALRKLEGTWLKLAGSPGERTVTLANPGCRDFLLDILDDDAVASEQLDRIEVLEQFVSLAQAAYLFDIGHGAGAGIQRPELSNVMTSRRGQVTAKIRQLVDATLVEGPPASVWLKILQDAATLLAVFGVAEDTNWILGHLESLVGRPSDELFRLPVIQGLALAEAISGLKPSEPKRLSTLVAALATAAVGAISSIRDLDAFDAASDRVKSDELHLLVRERATKAMEAEYEYLLHSCEEARAIRTGIADLEQRAAWYGIEVDVAPLLDRADDLAMAAGVEPEWPYGIAEQERSSADELNELISQVFSNFQD